MALLPGLKRFSAAAASAALLSVFAAGAAQAVTIIGSFNFDGDQVRITLGNIDWNDNSVTNPPPNATETTGPFKVDNVRTGVFLDPAFGPSGTNPNATIEDMSENPLDANYMPVGNLPTPDKDFLVLAAKPTWRFIATYLAPGYDPDGAGPLLPSPYTLVEIPNGQGGTNVSATIVLTGTACDSTDNDCDDASDGVLSKWTAILTAQYTNTTISAMLATLSTGGQLPDNTWSGTFEAVAIPEPGSLALASLGLLGAGIASRRRLRGKA